MDLNISINNYNEFEQNKFENEDNIASLLSLALLNKDDKNQKSLSKKKLSESSSDESTEGSIEIKNSKQYKNNSIYKKNRKNSLFKKKLRKDIHGNLIEKGGKQKVSFKDDIKGNLLVELTFYNKEDYCYKGKNYKNYTFKKEAKDKEANNCSTCNIF